MTIRHLEHADTLHLPATGGPFSFRHTVWKPSHYGTGLEAHTTDRSWRTFRIGDLVVGVRLMCEDRTVVADIYTDGDYKPGHREQLRTRLTASYGLTEDVTGFTTLAEQVPVMRQPLDELAGMRQSCPENHFEISVVALLLQNTNVSRTTAMTRNLLAHHGLLVHFDGITLRAWFTPAEISSVTAETFKVQDRLGYRAKSLPHFAAFFRSHRAEALRGGNLVERFQEIKGVGPYTAAVMASHVSRDPSVFGIDVWNRKIFARALLGVPDADAEVITRRMNELFPGHAGTAALYLVEHEYLATPVAPLLDPSGISAWNQALEGTAT
ncbi:endonuclease III domain-containing protein [Streptomyces sp. NPDC006670]|uniref:endonuclease III domain-containing protein n=1 Tax=Streptomyces sp. NPDC006670 TaxID=3154476 RepID=UPI0033EE8EF4